MRGVVTLAAAQTLPRDADERALLIFVAFLVAVISLTVQGLTLPAVVRMLGLAGSEGEGPTHDEQRELSHELRKAAGEAVSEGKLQRPNGEPLPENVVRVLGARLTQPPDDDLADRQREVLELRLAIIEVMRDRLVELSRDGRYSTAALRHSLAELDADQVSLELRLDDDDD
jgi:monovalent cation/hydrogen antiporter